MKNKQEIKDTLRALFGELPEDVEKQALEAWNNDETIPENPDKENIRKMVIPPRKDTHV